MPHINSVKINRFRGIKKLNIENLSKINILVGDNNSGKTSVLEAIQLLFTEPKLNAVKSVIHQRTILNSKNMNFYTAFIKMFNIEQNSGTREFSIEADSSDGTYAFEVSGSENIISGDDALEIAEMPARERVKYQAQSNEIPEYARIFSGSIVSKIGKKTLKNSFTCTSLDYIRPGSSQSRKKVRYISAYGHLRYDLLQNIINNPAYKNIAVETLKYFDNSIADICYTKADDGTFMETVVTENGENMPFSVYGDGIKKVLFILNKLFESTDAILMIDEIETGLHRKYYDIVFPIIFSLAEKLDVQLFIATHSMEAIEAILKYANYEENSEDDVQQDPVKVITLKKVESNNGKEKNVVVRNVTGRYVYENRKAFDFEVRL